VADSTSAVSTVTVADSAIPGYALRVTHDYHSTPMTPNLMEATVTVTNTGASAVTNLLYRRVMDWDIEPTPFHEWVTIQNPRNSPQLLFDSDDGFASADPLRGPSCVSSEAVGVTQNEPAGANGPDWAFATAPQRVWLRAERDGTVARVYGIRFTESDPLGASCTGTVSVTVAHDMRAR